MYSFPDAGSRQTPLPQGFQDAGLSARSERRELSSYQRMDAGLTIKTREGDIVTLSTSRFSQLNAHEYTSQGTMTSKNGQASARYHERQIELASGESFSFSVQGDLNEQELADIENIISGIDGIIYEMAEGDMDEAVARALSMESYDSVAMYQANLSVARSYASYAGNRSTQMGPSLPAPDTAAKVPRPQVFASPFMKEVSSLLETQQAEALAHARQPLSQLFDHYMEQQALLEEDGRSDSGVPAEGGGASPMMMALETTARTVDQLIQEMVKDVFEKTLDQMV